MKIRAVLASLILGSFLVSCLVSCGFQQNPLDGKGEILKNARPGSGDVEKPTADPSDVIYIDAPDSVSFIEGKKDVIAVEVHLSRPGFTNVNMVIDNMADFRGASYDANSKKFEWAPPLGTVVDGLSSKFELSLQVIAKNPQTGVVYSRNKKVLLIVQRSPQDPQVLAINFPSFSNKLREGGVYNFTITAKDLDNSVDKTKGPEIAILPPTGNQISLAGFAKFKTRTFDVATSAYVFNFEMDLRNVELTNSSSPAGFIVQAISQFGRKSAGLPYNETLFTNLGTPLSTWSSAKILKNNQDNVVAFIIYDAKGESMISLDRNDNVPAGASIDCPQRLGAGAIECTLTWKPSLDPKNLPLSGNISMRVSSSNRDRSDTNVSQSTLQLNYQVVPGSNP